MDSERDKASRCRFSLSTLLVTIAVIATGLAALQFWPAPHLEDLVEEFNLAADEGRLEDASQIVKRASRYYPDSPTPKLMQWLIDHDFPQYSERDGWIYP